MNINKWLKHTAVYWGAPSYDGYGGKTFSAPVEIACRWSEKAILFYDKEGKQNISESHAIVDRDVEVDGFLYLGELSDLDSSSSSSVTPDDVEEARIIRGFTKVADLKGNFTIKRALMTWK